MKINEVISSIRWVQENTVPIQGTVQKVTPSNNGSKIATVVPTNSPNTNNAPLEIPIPKQGGINKELNGTYTVTAQTPNELQPGAKINIVNPTTPVTEEDDEYEEKSDQELIAMATEKGFEDELRLIDHQLVNRDDVIILLRGDIKKGDQTDSWLRQVEDPFYGSLAEIKRFAGL